jgi:hypothetical protein
MNVAAKNDLALAKVSDQSSMVKKIRVVFPQE